MRIAIYTLTRDRVEYTEHCFKTLKQKAWNVAYDHFVIDNGSRDSTPSFLKSWQLKQRILLPENIGISWGSNIMLDVIFATAKYDLIIKMDNDCEVVSENILGQLTEIFRDAKTKGDYILSPRVIGINRQPKRVRNEILGGRDIGITSIVGGLFHVVPAEIYANYRYPITLPKAWGQDDDFCHRTNQKGCRCGYVEGLKVNHYETTDGQAKRFPEYFERKRDEEKANKL